MRTLNRAVVAAGVEAMFALARDVERWPALLPHYRRVRVLARRDGAATVEMAAVRPFGPVAWPVWWVSEMTVDAGRHEVRYRHVRGITTGMDVVWRVIPAETGSVVEIVHEWRGPRWPLVGALAAGLVIGPVFVHAIAARTLAGLARCAEREGTKR